MIKKNLCFLFLAILILLPCNAYSIDMKYKFRYPPTYQLSPGYNMTTLKGSERVLEYYEGDDSLVFKGIVEVYPLPHRFHLEAFTLTDDDYYLDTGYAYKDLLLTRLVSIGIVHKLNHYDFSLPDVSTSYRYDERNPGDKYEDETSKTEFTLRLKMPNYPLHLYTRYFNYHKEGTIQQRNAIGYFGDITKTSQSREIDSDTGELTIGTNGHFGPVEVQYSHREKRFRPGGDRSLKDLYPASSTRPADRYPHNLMPELKSSSDFIRIHTSYTGRIVGALTLGNTRALNHYSGAKRRSFYSGVQLSYLPMHSLGFFLRWHYSDRDNDVGKEAVLRGDSNTLLYPLRQSIDRKTGSLTLNIRYRPLKGINIIGGYTITSIKRSDTDEWPVLNKNTTRQKYSLKVYGRIVKGLKFRSEYIFTRTKNPAYNATPERMHEVKLNTTYTPVEWLTGTIVYYFRKIRNPDLLFYNAITDEMLEEGSMQGTIHNLIALLTFTPLERTSFTVGAGFYRNRQTQALAFGRFAGDGTSNAGPPLVEKNVPYKDRSYQYLLSINHSFNDMLNIGCDLRYVISKGAARTEYSQTSYIRDLTKLDQRETGADINITYRIFNGVSFETTLSYSRFEDRIESDNTGRAYKAVMMVKKRW